MSLKDDLLARLAYGLSPVMTRVSRDLRFPGIRMASTEQISLPTREGPVRCTVYRPDVAHGPGVPDDGRPLPVLVNFHGGGFILGNPAQDDHICRYLAHHTPCVVVNVHYTTAPYARYPVQIHQGYDVTRWIAEHPDGWDGGRVAVLGHSAGGMLAAAVTRMARDAGTPRLLLQILDYPGTDMATPPSQRTANIPNPALPVWMLEVAMRVYCPDPARRSEPLCSPVLAPDMQDLPPALIITADHDILRAEADLYATRLAAAGVPVRHLVSEGMDHAFTSHHLERAVETFTLMVQELRSAYGATSPLAAPP